EIVHNHHVVDDLRAKGAIFIDDLDEVPRGSRLIYSAHGVSPQIREQAAARGLAVIDATCPLVTKVHVEAVRMAKEDYDIVLIGHRGHVEVEGTMGHATDRMRLVETVDDVQQLDISNPERLGCVTQTTLSMDDTRDVMDALQQRFPQIQLPRNDDICYATQNRQNAVKKLAREADVIVVVGDPESSNSNRLVELGAKLGVRSFLLQSADDIEPEWLETASCVGVTAGASAPEVLVEQVVARLVELAPGTARTEALPTVDEDISFKLPAALR
ncbi:MAG: 4-hydroxy-3-methylbut-2-enyl diphosphate reductase, partial [Myxococcota bacterium]